MKRIRVLLLYAVSAQNATFSYQTQWPRQFAAHPAFECTSVNVLDPAWLSKLRTGWLAHSYAGDVVVLLHSMYSNSRSAPSWLIEALAKRPQPRVFFIGNEYKLMPQKMEFCDE